MKRSHLVFLDCLKEFAIPFAIFCINSVLMLLVFSLYKLKLEPFYYTLLLSFFFMLCFFIVRLIKGYRAASLRQNQLDSILYDWKAFESATSLSQQDYQQMIEKLGRQLEKLTGDFYNARKDMQDFYTSWVHQIKTPIAVLKLELDKSEGSKLDRRALQEELFRIEQYTEMILAYQRLDSSSNDLLIKEYSLDELIREVIRKFASQFIYKKLKLIYEGCQEKIVIDKKWFSCILEQLLSNAIKYTQEGSITIKVQNGILSVKDTGIGIAAEDIPRIFEKGYTGVNGRLNEKSSGLGLYLCSKAASIQNLELQVQSSLGEGSVFSVNIKEKLS